MHSAALYSNYLRCVCVCYLFIWWGWGRHTEKGDFKDYCCDLVTVLPSLRAEFEHGVENEKEGNAWKATGSYSGVCHSPFGSMNC